MLKLCVRIKCKRLLRKLRFNPFNLNASRPESSLIEYSGLRLCLWRINRPNSDSIRLVTNQHLKFNQNNTATNLSNSILPSAPINNLKSNKLHLGVHGELHGIILRFPIFKRNLDLRPIFPLYALSQCDLPPWFQFDK